MMHNPFERCEHINPVQGKFPSRQCKLHQVAVVKKDGVYMRVCGVHRYHLHAKGWEVL